jgi:tetratricopeptide (TPR) repeat protein
LIHLLCMRLPKFSYRILIGLVLFSFSHLSAQVDNQPGSSVEAQELSVKVVNLYKAGKFNDALPLAERAVSLLEKTTGADAELFAASLRNLSEVQLAKNKNAEAEATYDRYLDVFEKAAGANDARLTGALDRYVCLLIGTNKRSKAVDIQKRIYKLDNKFEFEDKEKTAQRSLEGAGIMAGKIDSFPRPTYLAEAKTARISGSVVYKVNLDESGKVLGAKTLCGNPLLVKGSENAILQARYKPTIVSGQPVKVTGIAIINFVL